MMHEEEMFDVTLRLLAAVRPDYLLHFIVDSAK